jgi:2'-5' RNA ligase
MNVFAVATILDIQRDPEALEAWNQIKDAFSNAALEVPGLLHFSWHVATSYQSGRIEDCLREATRDLPLIQSTSTGLGIFTSEQPVLYLPVNKKPLMTDLHHHLWECLAPISVNVNSFYDPENWIPHITLAYEDANGDQISRAAALLLRRHIGFRIQLDHLALIYRNGSENGIVTKIPFGRLL